MGIVTGADTTLVGKTISYPIKGLFGFAGSGGKEGFFTTLTKEIKSIFKKEDKKD